MTYDEFAHGVMKLAQEFDKDAGVSIILTRKNGKNSLLTTNSCIVCAATDLMGELVRNNVGHNHPVNQKELTH